MHITSVGTSQRFSDRTFYKLLKTAAAKLVSNNSDCPNNSNVPWTTYLNRMLLKLECFRNWPLRPEKPC